METKSLFNLHRALAQPVKMCMFDFPVSILDDLSRKPTTMSSSRSLLPTGKKPSNKHTRSSRASSSRGTLASRLKSEKGSQGSKNKIGRIKAAPAVKGTVTPGQICEYRKSKDAFGNTGGGD